jgi:hypothetical protein
MVRSAAVTMDETRAGVGVGLAAMTHVIRAAGELGEKRWANGAALVGPPVAVGAGSSAHGIHEEPELVEDVEFGFSRHHEAHLVALAFLVVLTHEAAECGAAFVLEEASVVVVIEDEFASEGGSPFRRAHAADGEGVRGILVAEGHEVCRLGAKESDHHVTSDTLLEAMGAPEDPGEAPGEARVGEVALERGLEQSVTVTGHDSVDNALESEVGRAERCELPEQGLEDRGRHG